MGGIAAGGSAKFAHGARGGPTVSAGPRAVQDLGVLLPQWPAPPNVRAAFTLRAGGVSAAPFDTLNVGAHVGDAPASVADNRQRVRTALALPAEPAWLEQVHGTGVVELD